jgi:hypothetical protein
VCPFIALFVDTSGSMNKKTVKNSYNKFLDDPEAANLTIICIVDNELENWIAPFITTLTPNSGSCIKPTHYP